MHLPFAKMPMNELKNNKNKSKQILVVREMFLDGTLNTEGGLDILKFLLP